MGKQGEFEVEGLKRKRVKEIDDAAEHYVAQRDKRMKLTEKEVEAKEALLRAMRKHKVETYTDTEAVPPLTVIVTPGKDNVKVTVAEEKADAGQETDEKPKRGRSAKEQRKLAAVNEEPNAGDGTDDEKDEA